MDNLKNDRYYIGKMMTDLRFIQEKMTGCSYEDFQTDELLQDSMMFRLIHISENARKLTEEYREQQADIPWGDVFGLRNRIVHEYGAPLPTDNMDTAQQVLRDLIEELNRNSTPYEIPDIPLDNVKNVDIARKILKQDIDQFKEEKYAELQREQWEEIYEYMQLIVANNGREKDLGDDNVIKVPTSEAAAYLEWILWRSFLAIDHTLNKPHEARGFNIDQDYMPVGTAPGGMPDMYFEFEDYVIVVEVTMSTNSRQEAMEGEPVRRHVADYAEKYDKPVYGIFVANKIDSNTAETFRIGVWYNRNDEKMALKIVPYTLQDYAEYFKSLFQKGAAKPEKIISLFEECFAAKEGREAPEWKQAISNIVSENSAFMNI